MKQSTGWTKIIEKTRKGITYILYCAHELFSDAALKRVWFSVKPSF